MRRSAVSVASNIAEACGRSTPADRARQLAVASGSACELEYQLKLAIELGYAPADTATIGKVGEVIRMLRALSARWRAEA
jgi:four helix bundle protein